jgi:hypothetical protein
MCCTVCSERDDLVDLVGSWQYEDNQVGDVDAFAREPYILRFKCLNTGKGHRSARIKHDPAIWHLI